MFDNDLLIAFAFMVLLFLRQITILKQPNKINYAPLMLGIGAISSVVHFITHPETIDTLLILKESFLPLLVSLLFYVVMNILHQAQKSEHARTQHEFTKALIQQVTQLKEFTSELETKMILNQDEERSAQEDVKGNLKHDMKALDTVQANQAKFLEKFEEMEKWYIDIKDTFENFSKVQLPSLDAVVHKHIDVLRIAEQDHFNKLKETLLYTVESMGDISQELDELKDALRTMSSISQNIARDITSSTIEQLSEVTIPFEKQVLSLKSHTEGVNTSLYESENRLEGIKEQSEMIMKQMILSSNKMNELKDQNSGLHDIFSTMQGLMKDIEIVKSEYVKSQAQLSSIIQDFRESKDEDIDSIREQMESLIVILVTKVDNSLEQLHKHYHIANEDISKSVQFLAKKAHAKNGYADSDS